MLHTLSQTAMVLAILTAISVIIFVLSRSMPIKRLSLWVGVLAGGMLVWTLLFAGILALT